jgi:hypothetical protein
VKCSLEDTIYVKEDAVEISEQNSIFGIPACVRSTEFRQQNQGMLQLTSIRRTMDSKAELSRHSTALFEILCRSFIKL